MYFESQEALKLLISNPMSPLQSLYDHPFYIYLLCLQGKNYNPHPEGSGEGVIILKDIISIPFIYVEQ